MSLLGNIERELFVEVQELERKGLDVSKVVQTYF